MPSKFLFARKAAYLMGTLLLGFAQANPLLDPEFWKAATPEAVEEAVRNGADLSARDTLEWTPLHHAAFYSPSPEVIIALVNLGADPNTRDTLGATPLHYAASNNPSPGVIAALVDLGADPNAMDKGGWRPLHYAAAYSKQPEVVLKLLELGADPKAKASDESTPWDLIQKNKDLEGSPAYWKLNDLNR